jgi:hypothetical protein
VDDSATVEMSNGSAMELYKLVEAGMIAFTVHKCNIRDDVADDGTVFASNEAEMLSAVQALETGLVARVT